VNKLKVVVASLACCAMLRADGPRVARNLKFADEQLTRMLTALGDSEKHPRSLDAEGNLRLVPSSDWTSGFFPGCLWLMYEHTQEEKWKHEAQRFTAHLIREQYNQGTHDLGFMMYCSFGNGYQLTGDENYKEVLLQSAKSLMTRFNPTVGCIRSWDHHEELWQFPVIIDNMMNLELLFWATRASGDSTFYKVAVTHARTTMKNHFREDYSTWHVLNYDTTTGAVLDRNTHQGYAHESCWSRGQAWALYGFTMCYRETKDQRFLQQAGHIADFILQNKNLPEDLVPYWDFNAPKIPHEERDASAGAIMCSALYELSAYLGNAGAEYRRSADNMLESLSSPKYLARTGTNGNFMMQHAVGSKPGKSEIDGPLIYADYYFLEANLRSMKTNLH